MVALFFTIDFLIVIIVRYGFIFIMKMKKLTSLIVLYFTLISSEVFAVENQPQETIGDQIMSEILGDVPDKKMAENANGDLKKVVEDDKGIFTFAVENDLFTGKDLGYTNGIRFSYVSSEESMPSYIRKASNYLPLLNKEGKKRISIAAGQSMYTPRNIRSDQFQEHDFLYAGWLYGSLGIISDTGSSYDNVVLTLGMVGPASRAEQTQKFVHHNVPGSAQPQGWNYQLKNEPGINFAYERKWRNLLEKKAFGVGVDLIPHVGTNLGNVYTNAAVGATFRLGYDLPADYGPPRIRPNLAGSDFFIPTKKLGGYLFTTVEMRAVARNIFLDGNSFQGGPSLDKRVMVQVLQYGATIIFKDARITYSNVLTSKEFKGQKNGTEFGALTFSLRL